MYLFLMFSYVIFNAWKNACPIQLWDHLWSHWANWLHIVRQYIYFPYSFPIIWPYLPLWCVVSFWSMKSHKFFIEHTHRDRDTRTTWIKADWPSLFFWFVGVRQWKCYGKYFPIIATVLSKKNDCNSPLYVPLSYFNWFPFYRKIEWNDF